MPWGNPSRSESGTATGDGNCVDDALRRPSAFGHRPHFSSGSIRAMEIDRKRPLSVTLIGLLFVFAGAGGVAFHAREFRTAGPIQYDLLGVTLVRVLAIV